MVHSPWSMVDGPWSRRRRERHALCIIARMKAKNLDDIVVYRKAMNGADAVSALLGQSAFSKDFDLKDQLSRSAGRIGPLIAEGFGQTTDRHLAVYLGRA